tara:strand:- start:45 stop:353 length:309 start_codon:yes stop_codon:yes gene_type:complete
MIIYNVTCNVEQEISAEWLKWMKEIHIPELMDTGIFISSQINKVLSGDDGGETYAIAYTCESMKDLHKYQVNFAPMLQQKHTDRYGTKVVAFRTLLEVVSKF